MVLIMLIAHGEIEAQFNRTKGLSSLNSKSMLTQCKSLVQCNVKCYSKIIRYTGVSCK